MRYVSFCNDKDFANYADNSTPYFIEKTPEKVISQSEKSSKSIFELNESQSRYVSLALK